MRKRQKAYREVSDSVAESGIRTYLKALLSEGRQRVNILEILAETKLPVDQVKRVMRYLKPYGVREVEA